MSDAYQQVCNLIYRYSELITLGDFDAVGEMFAEGVVTSESNDQVNRGAAAVAAFYRDGVLVDPDHVPNQVLITSNVQVYVDEEAGTASARACFTSIHEDNRGGLVPVVGWRYHDEFVRVDGEWRFKSRHIQNDIAGDINLHVPPHIFGQLQD
ncbi:MAG: nuclear transport factor 2 family protein [Deltaproteobacteria bacterium]|jgi:ketosteroid isomerase-like protein|nr:nuclear transport factor 2 family protein [Deltaproteobacteria bacterium]